MANNKFTGVNVTPPKIPQYIFDHAPLLHLYTSDRYRPSSISAFLIHTRPQTDFKEITAPPQPLDLANLNQLNSIGAKGGKDIYLTSNDDVTTNPAWLDGVKIDERGGTGDERTGVIVLVDKGSGVVDVFYFYFFAFNWGGIVLEKQLGDHVGDWEHTMIRFVNGVPKYVWLSQHANGEAYAFKALQKDGSGKRPVLYVANGSHAIYARPGPTDHTIPNLNSSTPFLLVDNCDSGPLYDPLLTSFIYTYTPSNPADPETASGKFDPQDPSSPVLGWLYFSGHWGDKAYPADDARQKGKDLFGFRKYGDGPTGPAFKDLGRKQVWPENEWAKGQKIRMSLDGSTSFKDRLARWGCFGGKSGAKGRGVERVDVDGRVVR